eukprot:2524543-Rhodomonas_salina.2
MPIGETVFMARGSVEEKIFMRGASRWSSVIAAHAARGASPPPPSPLPCAAPKQRAKARAPRCEVRASACWRRSESWQTQQGMKPSGAGGSEWHTHKELRHHVRDPRTEDRAEGASDLV